MGIISGARTISSLDSLGSNLSLVAWMDTFRIDIVVSDFGKNEKGKNKSKGKSGNFSQQKLCEIIH